MVKGIRSDNAPEFVVAAEQFPKASHDLTIPHTSESNARREIENKTDINGARSLLLQSGLSYEWWPYALKAYDHASNCLVPHSHNGDVVPYVYRYTVPAPFYPLAFGCLVTFKPYKTTYRGKFESGGIQGVYLGSYLKPGCIPDGSSYVVPLEQLTVDYDGFLQIQRTRDIKAVGQNYRFCHC